MPARSRSTLRACSRTICSSEPKPKSFVSAIVRSLLRLRQAEHALAQDVALDLVAAGGDREAVGVEMRVGPVAGVGGTRVAEVEAGVRSLDLHRDRGDVLEQLAHERL